MDDLLRRQNAAGQGVFDHNSSDGGDLNGGDGLHQKPGESDVGSGLELDRSLQRVAAQESWLNEQSIKPVESWLQSNVERPISIGGNDNRSTNLKQDNRERNLVVIDSRSNQLHELTRDLPDGTDLLVLNDSKSGTGQLKDFLAQQPFEDGYSKVSLIGAKNNDRVNFGSDNFNVDSFSQEAELIQSTSVLSPETNLFLYTAGPVDTAPFSDSN